MDILRNLLNVMLVLTSLFLICLVLIQRGKGGGLAGAFGGVGGSSAFGTKAGDVFTRVTIIVAGVWFLIAMVLVVLNNQGRSSAFEVPSTAARDVSDGSGKTGTGTETGEGAAKTTTPGKEGSTATSPEAESESGGDELPSPLVPESEPSESKSSSSPAPAATP